MRLVTAIAALATLAMAPACQCLASDDGFATRSITNMGLTGDRPHGDTFAQPGPGAPGGDGAAPSTGGTGSFGPPARGSVGAGPGAPAPGGGTFAAPARR